MADIGAAPVPMSEKRTFTLDKEQELRFEVDHGQCGTLTLVSGTAEVFGAELALGVVYKFSGAKQAVYTWHGCTLELEGTIGVAYVADETPMTSYLNCHAVLDARREQAKSTGGRGPRVVLAGPVDVGKSSLSKILLNYAVRRGYQPLYVDLDIGQGAITVPGMLGAVQVERPLEVESGTLDVSAPLVYFYGHVTPGDNSKLFVKMLNRLAATLELRCERDFTAQASGMVINTCGWIEGLGYELLVQSIEIMNADVVLVIGHDRLYNDLAVSLKGRPIEVVKLAKSGGVVSRDATYRRKTRNTRIKEYFYGPSGDLCPMSTVIHFRDVSIYRVGSGPIASSAALASALPLGMGSTLDPVKLVEVIPDASLVHSLLGVSHADQVGNLLDANLAGFVYVTEVNLELGRMVVLSPSPGAIPGRFLLSGSVKWLE